MRPEDLLKQMMECEAEKEDGHECGIAADDTLESNQRADSLYEEVRQLRDHNQRLRADRRELANGHAELEARIRAQESANRALCCKLVPLIAKLDAQVHGDAFRLQVNELRSLLS